MRLLPLALAATLGLAATTVAMVPAADAQSRRGSGESYTTAESRYGPQTITAPVRNGPQGRLEVRLPGGTWIECGRSCSDTLRRETIDFWQSRNSGITGGPDGPGYLRFRW
jgi:hypothetical protein